MRKLSKRMRVANYIYQIITSLISGASLGLTVLNTEGTPKIFYEIVSICGTAFPVVWSKILDASKEYYEQATPPESPAVSV